MRKELGAFLGLTQNRTPYQNPAKRCVLPNIQYSHLGGLFVQFLLDQTGVNDALKVAEGIVEVLRQSPRKVPDRILHLWVDRWLPNYELGPTTETEVQPKIRVFSHQERNSNEFTPSRQTPSKNDRRHGLDHDLASLTLVRCFMGRSM